MGRRLRLPLLFFTGAPVTGGAKMRDGVPRGRYAWTGVRSRRMELLLMRDRRRAARTRRMVIGGEAEKRGASAVMDGVLMDLGAEDVHEERHRLDDRRP
ncbi:hypothetical protein A0H81_14958 [Grifola frondosa]|uniref:Uncharacterized protein n=1 Tax=Grifola frondosa TaxID=5627 RepID=A0A1C7LJU8_GRIFR|nr:hypothetical protein A0H81_14958 [Grifola frondosa]